MLDLTPTDEDDRVEAVDDSLRNTKTEIQRLEERKEELQIHVPAQREAVSDLRADVQIGEATEEELNNAEEELEALEAEAENIDDRLDTLHRVQSRLETKRKQALEEAAIERQQKLDAAAEAAMDALLSALSDAEDARKRLSEVEGFAKKTFNHVDVPTQCLGKAQGVGLFDNYGEQTHAFSTLKDRFA